MTKNILKLVDDYGNACLKAGQSNSGYCIDPSGSYQWETMQKLRKALRESIEALGANNSATRAEEG